jgi:hypothetical protein
MDDDVIQEVRKARDAIAQSHGYVIDKIVAHLRSQDAMGDRILVDRTRSQSQRGVELIVPVNSETPNVSVTP